MKNLEEKTITSDEYYSNQMKTYTRISNKYTRIAALYVGLLIVVSQESEGYIANSNSNLKSNHATPVLHADTNPFRYNEDNTSEKIPIDSPIPYTQAIIPTVSDDIRKYFKIRDIEQKFRNHKSRTNKYYPSMGYTSIPLINSHNFKPRNSIHTNVYRDIVLQPLIE